MTSKFHDPAFLLEIVSFLEKGRHGIVFDAYGGDGSYGEMLLGRFPELEYYYFDIDNKAIETASERLKQFSARVHIKKMNCRYLDKRVSEEGIDGIDAVIYDPGLRLEHVSNPERGFSVKLPGPLDGRFDNSTGPTIADVVNDTDVDELIDILKTVEIPFPSRIARRIEAYRLQKRITTTGELAKIADGAVPFKAKRKKVPVSILVMLALRMHVNDELKALSEAVEKGFNALNKNGMLLTISYHSGEARVYKRFARQYDERYAEDENKKLRAVTKKALKPSEDAINRTPLIRSAQLRVYEKID